MDETSRDALVEDRIAQLRVIADRRNALLRQMYYMVHRRESMGALIRLQEDEGDGLEEFLDKFDLDKNPETGSIEHFDHQQFAPPLSSRHIVEEPEPLQSPPPQTPATPRATESDDELDLIGSPNFTTRTQSRASSEVVVVQREPSEEKLIVVHRAEEAEPEQIVVVDGGDTTDDDEPVRVTEQEEEEEGSASQVPIVVEDPVPKEPLQALSEIENAVNEAAVVSAEEAPKNDVASAQVHEPPSEANEMVVEEDLFSAQDELTPPPPPQPEPTLESLEPLPQPPTEPVSQDDVKPEQDVAMPMASEESKGVVQPPVRAQTPSSDGGESMVIDDDDDDDQEVADAIQQPSQPSPPPKVAPLPPTAPLSPVAVAPPVVPAAEPPLPLAPTPPKSPVSIPQQPPVSIPQQPPVSLPQQPLPATPRATVLIPEPTSILAPPVVLDISAVSKPEETPNAPPTASSQSHGFRPNYTLPPLKVLSADFSRKTKPGKQQRKRDKNADRFKEKDDWAPMGTSRWGALLRANPVHPKLSRAPKCLSTREWSVAMTELRLVRALEQVEVLKDAGRWSFRQPKKQRGVGGLSKTHWDYLLDEMKWMRIDFREERKWKLALAYHLSTAVLEWHCFSSHAERVAQGICVGWRPPKADETDDVPLMETDDPLGLDEEPMDISMEEESPVPPVSGSLLTVDYGSDDDDDDEQEKQSVMDALEPTSVLDDALDAAEKALELPPSSGFELEFKSALDSEEPPPEEFGKMDVDEDGEKKPVIKKEELDESSPQPLGLKESSSNPSLSQADSLTASVEPGSLIPPTTKSSSKSNVYAPLRECLAYSEPSKLFLDSRDVEEAMKNSTAGDAALFPTDLSEIFPDLPPLAMLDVAPGPGAAAPEGRPKKSEKRADRDDPNKRVEETTYTKLFPVGKFMHTKPTLIGPLQPAKRWKNGQWIPAEDSPALDVETPPVKIQDSLSELFNAKFTIPPKSVWLEQQKEKETKEREAREREAKESKEPFEIKDIPKRTSTHIWTTVDDNLLRSLVDRYPNNWPLIAECYNSAHVSISTDTRTARDCHDRWKDLAPRPPEPPRIEEPPVASTSSLVPSTPSMTTRGVKRLASASISGPSSMASGSDAKKRRRHHFIVDSIRKVGKKRAEQAQKTLNNQRKPSAIHETHAQYTRLPKYTPAELSRMKTEKEHQDMQTARRKHEEMNRAQQQRLQMGTATPVAQPQAAQQPAQPVQQQTPPAVPAQQAAANNVPGPQAPAQAPSPMPQQQALLQAAQQQHQQRLSAAAARSGVNISQQQQRVGSPMNVPGMRLTPQQQQQLMHERMRQQAAAAQQTLIQHQQQQAMLAAQAAAGQTRAGTSSPRPAAPRQYMNVPGLQNYTSEQIAQMIQMANQQSQQQLQHQQRQ